MVRIYTLIGTFSHQSDATIEGESVQTVNARDLHRFLEVKTRFNDWIANRIADFNFVENQDFVTLTENLVNGGRLINYHITLDMAKELSMVERNEKARTFRRRAFRDDKGVAGRHDFLDYRK